LIILWLILRIYLPKSHASHTNPNAKRYSIKSPPSPPCSQEPSPKSGLSAQIRILAALGASAPTVRHQVWRDGRNISLWVPASEAAKLSEPLLCHMQLSIADLFNDRVLLPNNEPSTTFENSRRNSIVHSLFGPFEPSYTTRPEQRRRHPT
jgi:hypothetical protein